MLPQRCHLYPIEEAGSGGVEQEGLQFPDTVLSSLRKKLAMTILHIKVLLK